MILTIRIVFCALLTSADMQCMISIEHVEPNSKLTTRTQRTEDHAKYRKHSQLQIVKRRQSEGQALSIPTFLSDIYL